MGRDLFLIIPTQSVLVAAEIVSQLKQDHFAALGVERRFGLDLTELERKFYQLSREFHPDHFTLQEAAVRQRALDKMTEINEAYRVLKSPSLRREHLLELFDVKLAAHQTQIPVEIAESWFELQESLMEDPGSAQKKLTEFQASFLELRRANEAKIQALEANADQSLGESRSKLLIEIAALISEQSYFVSLARDIEQVALRSSR